MAARPEALHRGLAEAEAGRLDDAVGRQIVAARMLDDEKAREQQRRFHAMWLGFDGMNLPKPVTAKPSLKPCKLTSTAAFRDAAMI